MIGRMPSFFKVDHEGEHAMGSFLDGVIRAQAIGRLELGDRGIGARVIEGLGLA
jgi:hypothetical protein